MCVRAGCSQLALFVLTLIPMHPYLCTIDLLGGMDFGLFWFLCFIVIALLIVIYQLDIIFCNARRSLRSQEKLYRQLGLTDEEIERIKKG